MKMSKHRKKWMSLLVLSFGLFFQASGLAVPEAGTESLIAWEPGRTFRGIQIFTREKKDSDRQDVKAVATIKVKPEIITRVSKETNHFKEWMLRLKDVQIIRHEKTPEDLYYFLWQMPYPLDDRDAVTLRKEEIDPNTGTVTVRYVSFDGVIPEVDKRIRIRDFECSVEIIPQGNQAAKVSFLVKMDPTGTLPAPLVNLLTKAVTYKSLSNLKRFSEKLK